jgi:hypothetical protein
MGLGSVLAGRYPAKRAVVNVATAASHPIVAAVPGKSIVLLSAFIKVANAQTLTWRSGTTPLTGAMAFATSDLMYAVDSESGIVQTVPGEALNLLVGAATQVSGSVTYAEV